MYSIILVSSILQVEVLIIETSRVEDGRIAELIYKFLIS